MQLEAMEARLIPVAAAMVGAGVKLADALSMVDEFRDGFDEVLAAGTVPDAALTPMQRFRRAIGAPE